MFILWECGSKKSTVGFFDGKRPCLSTGVGLHLGAHLVVVTSQVNSSNLLRTLDLLGRDAWEKETMISQMVVSWCFTKESK